MTDTNTFSHSEDKSIIDIDLSQYAETAYLQYSMAVVKGRQIPFVQDGQKPVQRRILYTMGSQGWGSTSKRVKSARVVGEVIGKYHPHGDSSIYEAMIRQAQDFVMRYTLVDGEGNFGSRDGDSAAAMRYTEARLAPISDLMLSEIGRNTVDFQPTYDGSLKEPKVLPARLPFILLNGASGVAVGIATEIPPHNLRECVAACIAAIKNPKITHEEVCGIIKGPDYPTGARIISSPEEISQIYSEGRGSIRVRCQWDIESGTRGSWKLVVNSLPYGVSTQKIMQEIDACMNPEPTEKNGKKTFSPEQARVKQLFTNLIDTYRDESDLEHPLRIVFEPKTYKQSQEELIQALLAHTSMEVGIPVNMYMIGLDKKPSKKSITEIIQEWTSFRMDTVRRRCEHERAQCADRLHILDGRATILDHIEEVVRIIRDEKDAKTALMERFALSERQAEDILEIRLRQIYRTERHKIDEERKELSDRIAQLDKILGDDRKLRDLVIKELEADAKAFGDDRKTVIEPDAKVGKSTVAAATIQDEPITIAISERGWVRARAGHGHAKDSFQFKTGDALKDVYETRSTGYLVVMDDQGKTYSMRNWEVPIQRGGDGAPLSGFFEFGSAKIKWVVVGMGDETWILASDSGYGFVCGTQDMVSRLKAGKNFLTIDTGETPMPPVQFKGDAPDPTVLCMSTNKRLVAFPFADLKKLAKGGKGMAFMGFDKDAKLEAFTLLPQKECTVVCAGKNIRYAGEDFLSFHGARSSSKKGKHIKGAEQKGGGFKDCSFAA